jgi:tRNA-dihydrouridine synthase A
VKARWPELEVIVNGGIREVGDLDEHLAHVDGVMIGRAAYQAPVVLGEMDRHVFSRPEDSRPREQGSRIRASLGRGRSHMCAHRGSSEIMAAYRAYMERELAAGTRLQDMTRHALGLFAGEPGARRFRRILSDAKRLKAGDIAVVDEALEALADAGRRRAA